MALRHALRSLGGWRGCAPALGLNGLAGTVYLAAGMLGRPGWTVAGFLAVVLTSALAAAAVLRPALADRHPGDTRFLNRAGGLIWSATAGRLLIASLLAAILIGFVTILTLVALTALAGGMLESRGVTPAGVTHPGQFVEALGGGWAALLLAVFLIAVSGVLWLAMRIDLAQPATADQNAVRVLKTWPLTRDAVLPMLAAAAAIEVPFLLLFAAVYWLGREAVAGGSLPAALLCAAAVAFPSALLRLPLRLGAQAFFYRRFTPMEDGPPPAT